MEKTEKKKFTKAEISWVLYDVGNSALVLLATSIIPVYFSHLASQDASMEDMALVAWSYAETIASLIIALLMPILGSVADMEGMKKKFLIGCVGTGVVATVAMGFPENWLAFLIIYILSALALNMSFVFYDALLVDATTDEHMDEVSSHGYAWGYIGSCIPFVICLLIVLNEENLGLGLHNAMLISFLITSVWWAGFTVPLIKNVTQKHFKPLEEHAFSNAIKGIGTTLKSIWADEGLRWFIIAYFFYIDGVHTVIKVSTIYGDSLGIDSTQLILALLVTQFVAFPSAIIYGKLASKYGTRKMLLIAIVAYFCITTFAAFFLKTATEFWILAICVGMFQGGIQALSRSEFGKLCPKEHANEYFGFFDIFGKYAAILGTFLMGTFTAITGDGAWGILSIAVLFIVGFVVMLKVPDRVTAEAQ